MKKRINAFKHAFRGASTLIRTQAHARFHCVATALVLILGFFCKVSTMEWALLVFAITLVWVTEGLNTALEFLADEVSLERREGLKRAKDIAAFSVLAASTAAALIGCLIFTPCFR